MFLVHTLSVLEYFLKDHVTLKSNDAGNSALQNLQFYRFY